MLFLSPQEILGHVGTTVRDRKYEASMANTTASASGTNRYRATPDSKNIGANTMQMESVETKAGVAIAMHCRGQLRHVLIGLCLAIAIDVFDFDRGVVHQNADCQSEPTECHNVDGFADRTQHNDGVRIASGWRSR